MSSPYTTNVPLLDGLKVRIPRDAAVRKPPPTLPETAWDVDAARTTQCSPKSADADQLYIRWADLLETMEESEREHHKEAKIELREWVRLDLVTLPLSAGLVQRIRDGARDRHGNDVERFLDSAVHAYLDPPPSVMDEEEQRRMRLMVAEGIARALNKPAKKSFWAKLFGL